MNDKNDTISTKKFLILFPVLFIILILLIIYIVNATNDSKVNLYSDNINEDLKYLNEAKKLLYKYINVVDPYYCNPFDTGFTDECKIYIAYKNLEQSDYMLTDCEELYYDINNNYIPSIGGYCNLYSTISYEVLNNYYLSLFELDKPLSKINYNFKYSYLDYKDFLDSFIDITLDNNQSDDYIKYKILNTNKTDEKITIIVAYSLVYYDDNYKIKLNDGKIINYSDDDFESLINQNLIDKYAFEFKIKDDKNYLTDFYRYYY